MEENGNYCGKPGAVGGEEEKQRDTDTEPFLCKWHNREMALSCCQRRDCLQWVSGGVMTHFYFGKVPVSQRQKSRTY